MQTETLSEAAASRPALSVRGMVIGGIGAAVITASSLYVALKLGALPWPIVFAALVSLFFLKMLGKTSLNEANVTHTAMSAGSMVAGGLAFTIPGYWMLEGSADIAFWQVLLIALSGVVLGLIATACVRRYFVDTTRLPYPIGVSAAESLLAANEAGALKSKTLFGSLGFAAAYAFLRDNLRVIPAMLFNTDKIPGVAFGIYNSPMLLAVGFMVGPIAVFVWFLGALIGDFGVMVAGTAAGLWDMAQAAAIKTSLGMGLMLGAGVGVVAVQIISLIRRGDKEGAAAEAAQPAEGAVPGKAQAAALGQASAREQILSTKARVIAAPLVSAAVASLAAWALGLGLVPSVLLVAGTWIAILMSSQSAGATGINPMEVFGVLVLLVIQVFCHDLSMASLFFIAAIVAVACGLTGDVMNDFKAGAILGTDPRDQWIAQAVGGIIGAVVASAVLVSLVSVFGTESFGPGKEFVAAQASVVAAMVGGVPDIAWFVAGVAVGALLAAFKLPCMTLGLGVYLPFYLSFTAFLGGLIKVAYDRLARGRQAESMGLAVASGVLGGESLIGVLAALVVMGMSFFGG
ncbi:MAG: OPT/YSL family transporter [Eggerthellaceae bacterium]|nr:OPT/YSL family transporter [Eggerthellaceae bacterium]